MMMTPSKRRKGTIIRFLLIHDRRSFEIHLKIVISRHEKCLSKTIVMGWLGKFHDICKEICDTQSSTHTIFMSVTDIRAQTFHARPECSYWHLSKEKPPMKLF